MIVSEKRVVIKRFILFFMMFLFIISLVFAEGCASEGFMGSFQQNTDVTLTEVCPTCTYINISVKDPQSNFIFTNQPMTLEGNSFIYNLSSENTTLLGTYFVEGASNLDLPLLACFVITNVKREISTAESGVYTFLIIGALVVFLLTLWGAIALPYKNRRNEMGQMFDIEYLKYVKISLIFISYALFVWIANLLLSASNNLVTLTQYSGFFTMTFEILRNLIWPVLIGMFLWFGILMIRDLQLKQLLDRGIHPK